MSDNKSRAQQFADQKKQETMDKLNKRKDADNNIDGNAGLDKKSYNDKSKGESKQEANRRRFKEMLAKQKNK